MSDERPFVGAGASIAVTGRGLAVHTTGKRSQNMTFPSETGDFVVFAL